MDEFFRWLSNNPVATTTLIVSFGVLVTSATLIYLVAFFQGREISFWPPKIGQRPSKSTPLEPVLETKDTVSFTEAGPAVRRGTVLHTASGNKIVIESNFYGGANATLYRAKNSLNERVIVKVYWRGLMPGSPSWELFNQEQRTAEILTHRNVVKTLDRGLFGGYPFTIMEYLDGGTLRDWLRAHEHMPGPDILSIAGQVADAIDFAHSRGVIHRDIKPGNILFESDAHGRVALGDFGIARILGAVERDITATGGEFVGSPGYLAPEVLEGREISKASDIYSFGVVLYEIIAGRIPFDEFQDVFAILRVKVSQDAPDIRTYRGDVPEGIATRLAQTLSRHTSKRPKSARTVLSGLEKEINGL